jgi:dolichol-phosphate mannosyltransferase
VLPYYAADVPLTLVRFLVVGASGVVVNSAALFVLYQVLGLPLLLASAMSVELAIANNFVWNDRWTFHVAGRPVVRFVKFNVVSLCGLALTASTLWVLVQQANVNYLLANLAGMSLAAVCNFGASVLWTWRGVPS